MKKLVIDGIKNERIKFAFLVLLFTVLSVLAQSMSAKAGETSVATHKHKNTRHKHSKKSQKLKKNFSKQHKSAKKINKERSNRVTYFSPEREKSLIVMTSPEGVTERFESNGDELTKAINKNSFNDFDVTLNGPSYLCSSAKNSSWRSMKRVETELELTYIIATLKNKPRRDLTEIQKQTLSKVPVCSPFLSDLAVLHKLLHGYTLVQM